MVKKNSLSVFLLLFAINTFTQSDRALDQDTITQLLYQHTNDDSPGMAVGIVQDGEISYEYYLGYANLEHQIKIDQHTRFNIASNAKQFTAFCILELVDQGKVSLADDIRQYLPDLYKTVEEKITIAHLLTHTSGIRDVHTLWSLKGQTWWKSFIDNSDAIVLLKKQHDLNFAPGTDYLYSNSNYILLAEIVSVVSGEEFSTFSKGIFDSCGLSDTHFQTNYMEVIPNKARPYGEWNGWKEYPAITEIHGDGGLFTTLRDQLKWEQIIQRNSGKYLSTALIDQSQAPIVDSVGYGYGLMFDRNYGVDYTYHDGSTGAYHSTFLRFPEEKISFIILSNSGSVPTNYLAWQMAAYVLKLDMSSTTYSSNPKKVEKLKDSKLILGAYQDEEGTIIKITKKQGAIYREIYQREPIKLIQEKGGLFEYETIKGLKMNFTQIGETGQQFTLYLSSQAPNTYHKIPDFDLTQFDQTELEGQFYNDETDTEIGIAFVEGTSYVIIKDGKELEAELIIKDYLRIDSYEIRALRDNTGRVIGLSVTNGRIRNVIFTRTDS